MVKTRFCITVTLLMVLILPFRQLMAEEEPVSDVRILIDVSGSMKQNDPRNLRTPALEMVVGLLPEGSKAGVWTFAKYVNMLVPHKDVTEQWRQQAQSASSKIHSKGLFTNIEQVLNKATSSHKKPDPKQRRSVILLSDGLVDLSTPEDKVSLASRQRILNDTVPRLKQANVAVHTIALADSSDHELLRDIALATDGWYEQVDSAEELQRVFLHLFEKAAARDTVPLTDNHFKIDDSVEEMTVLAFRTKQSKNTELILPDQSRISIQTEDDSVRWRHSEEGFDLVTITEPQSGEWFIDAELDPDNRVMVMTDLKLQTSDLPNNILIGESFDFTASLTEKNEVIARQDFLSLVDVKVRHENEVSDVVEEDLNQSQKKGVYRTLVGDTFQDGRNDVVTRVSSGTFERERRQSINVVAMPFTIDIDQVFEQDTRTHRLILKPDSSLIAEDSITVAAMLTAGDGSEWSYDVLKNSDNDWQLTIAELQAGEEYTVNLQIKGETLKGRQLFLQPDAIILLDETPQPVINTEDILSNEVAEKVEEEATVELEQNIVDELGGDIDELLPEVGDEILSLSDEDVLSPDIKSADANETAEVSTTTLMYGNIIIFVLLVAGIFVWRQKFANAQNPGEQL